MSADDAKLTSYTSLRDFLDRYTNEDGVIQGDPATIAAEAVAAKLIDADEQHAVQFADEDDACAIHEVAYRICGCPIPGADENKTENKNIAAMRAIVNEQADLNPEGLIAWAYDATPEAVSFVLAQPIDGDGEHDGRSNWTWLRLANGDLCLAVFPHGETYMEVSEGALAPEDFR